MGFDQIAIALCGLLAAWLNQDLRVGVRRWAAVLGLVSQPFWFYSAIVAHQWGVVILSIGYSVAYVRGVRLGWEARDA